MWIFLSKNERLCQLPQILRNLALGRPEGELRFQQDTHSPRDQPGGYHGLSLLSPTVKTAKNILRSLAKLIGIFLKNLYPLEYILKK